MTLFLPPPHECLEVRFYHNNGYDSTTSVYPRSTSAVATGGANLEPIIASSFCNPSDQFCKKTGRRVAFQRLLGMLSLDKPTKRVAWQAFKDAFPKDGLS